MVVNLITCKNEFEAEIIKGALENEGIESILQGQNMSQIYGGIGAMPVNILVDEKDYDKARTFIDSREEPEKIGSTAEEIAKMQKENNVGCTIDMICLFICMGLYQFVNATILERYFEHCSTFVFIIITIAFICFFAALCGFLEKLAHKYFDKKK